MSTPINFNRAVARALASLPSLNHMRTLESVGQRHPTSRLTKDNLKTIESLLTKLSGWSSDPEKFRGFVVALRNIVRASGCGARCEQLRSSAPVMKFLVESWHQPVHLRAWMHAANILVDIFSQITIAPGRNWMQLLVSELGGPDASADGLMAALQLWAEEADGNWHVVGVGTMLTTLHAALLADAAVVDRLAGTPDKLHSLLTFVRQLLLSTNERGLLGPCVLAIVRSKARDVVAAVVGDKAIMSAMADLARQGGVQSLMAIEAMTEACPSATASALLTDGALAKALLESVPFSRAMDGKMDERAPDGHEWCPCGLAACQGGRCGSTFGAVDIVRAAVRIACTLHDYGGHAGRVLVRTHPPTMHGLRARTADLEDRRLAARVRAMVGRIDKRLAMVCAACGRKEDGTGCIRGSCEACKGPHYCGTDCQREHWEREHKKECRKMRGQGR